MATWSWSRRRADARRRPGRLARPLLALLLAAGAACAERDGLGLPPPQHIAQGVRLYRLDDPALLDPGGPIAVQLLRLDPSRVRLESALANGEIMGTESVPEMAARHQALAAINAGFFAPNGDPTGLLQVDGQLVSDTRRARGAVAVSVRDGRTSLLFDLVTATARLRLDTAEGAATVPIAGVDTVRQRGKLMLYTPRYHAHTDTAGKGIEWILDGEPLMVHERRHDAGSSAIPASGFVLSYGGLEPPPPLDDLDPGDRVAIEREFATVHGSDPRAWASAAHVIGGAGLLVRDGQPVTDWTEEDLRTGFSTERHPRTMIGAGSSGEIWLVTVDGRNPSRSLGMSFLELQRLAARLQLTHALNLDGGGSTTMVVAGTIVNHPSDAGGARKVSDAILVMPGR